MCLRSVESVMFEKHLELARGVQDMACATAYLQYVVKYILENCKEDIDFFNTWIEKGVMQRLSDVVEKEFAQLTYSDTIEFLLKAKMKFEFPELFLEVGGIKRYSIHYDRSGRSKGTAEVVFSIKDHALAAVKRYNNVQLDGKPMRIEIVGTNIEKPVSFPPAARGMFINPNSIPQRQHPRQYDYYRNYDDLEDDDLGST